MSKNQKNIDEVIVDAIGLTDIVQKDQAEILEKAKKKTKEKQRAFLKFKKEFDTFPTIWRKLLNSPLLDSYRQEYIWAIEKELRLRRMNK